MSITRRELLGATALSLLGASPAWGYGYSRDEDPLLSAFRSAVRAARSGDLSGARKLALSMRWQTTELASDSDLKVDFQPTLLRAHSVDAAATITAWSNLLYLALLQKFHWNQVEKLTDYHKAKARLESALAYYEGALAGNVRLQDAARKKRDPKARSRHEDIIRQFAIARRALGSPGLFGAGRRAPAPLAFSKATLRIAGHLRAAFPGFARPRKMRPPKKPGASEKPQKQ